jgi:hypothetical protein
MNLVQVDPTGDKSLSDQGANKSLHHSVQTLWEQKHFMIENLKSKPVPKCPQAHSFCRMLGMCLCKRPDLRTFRAAFIAVAKTLYIKSPGNKLKPIFEDSFGVILLEWFRLDDDMAHDEPVESTFLHLPWTNQNSWAMATVELVHDIDLEHSRVARALGRIALRAAPLPHTAGHDIFASLGISAVPQVFASKDLKNICRMRMYAITNDRRSLTKFVPAAVEVIALDCQPVVFWPGTERAFEIAENHAKAKKISASSHA